MKDHITSLMTRLRGSAARLGNAAKSRIRPGIAAEGSASVALLNDFRDDSIPAGPDRDAQVSDIGIVMFDRKKTAVGLNWRPWRDDHKVKALAEQASMSASTMVSFETYIDMKKDGMVGLGAPEHGHERGIPALVTMIDPELTGPRWIGMFRIGSGREIVWLAGMRDGVIYEDTVFPTVEDAYHALLTELDAPDWTRIFAPEDIDVPNATVARIDDVVRFDIGRKLKPVDPLRAYGPRTALVTIAVLGIGGAYGVHTYFEYLEEKRLSALRDRDTARPVVHIADYPWQQNTGIMEFIAHCKAEIEDSITIVPGWNAQPVSCSVDRGDADVSTAWSRSEGRIAWLRAAMDEDEPQPILNESGNEARYSRDFDIPYREDLVELDHWSPSRIQSVLRERFQTLGLDISLSAREQRAPTRGAREDPIFNYHDVGITTDTSLMEYGELLIDVPALVPQTIIYNPGSHEWSLVAQVYHEPILPPRAEVR